jgi:hypothetical protein
MQTFEEGRDRFQSRTFLKYRPNGLFITEGCIISTHNIGHTGLFWYI